MFSIAKCECAARGCFCDGLFCMGGLVVIVFGLYLVDNDKWNFILFIQWIKEALETK